MSAATPVLEGLGRRSFAVEEQQAHSSQHSIEQLANQIASRTQGCCSPAQLRAAVESELAGSHSVSVCWEAAEGVLVSTSNLLADGEVRMSLVDAHTSPAGRCIDTAEPSLTTFAAAPTAGCGPTLVHVGLDGAVQPPTSGRSCSSYALSAAFAAFALQSPAACPVCSLEVAPPDGLMLYIPIEPLANEEEEDEDEAMLFFGCLAIAFQPSDHPSGLSRNAAALACTLGPLLAPVAANASERLQLLLDAAASPVERALRTMTQHSFTLSETSDKTSCERLQTCREESITSSSGARQRRRDDEDGDDVSGTGAAAASGPRGAADLAHHIACLLASPAGGSFESSAANGAASLRRFDARSRPELQDCSGPDAGGIAAGSPGTGNLAAEEFEKPARGVTATAQLAPPQAQHSALTLMFPDAETEQRYIMWHAQQCMQWDLGLLLLGVVSIMAIAIFPPFSILARHPWSWMAAGHFGWFACYLGPLLLLLLQPARYARWREWICLAAWAYIVIFVMVGFDPVIRTTPAILLKLRSPAWFGRSLGIENLAWVAFQNRLRWAVFAPACFLHWALFAARLPELCSALYQNSYPFVGGCVPVGAAALTGLGLVLPLYVTRYLDVRQRQTFLLRG